MATVLEKAGAQTVENSLTDIADMEAEHLESLETILRMAQMNECSVVQELEGIMVEAKDHFQRVEQREIT